VAACAKAKKLPPAGWTETDQPVLDVFSPTTRELSLSMIHVPMLEEKNSSHILREQIWARLTKSELQSMYTPFTRMDLERIGDNPLTRIIKNPLNSMPNLHKLRRTILYRGIMESQRIQKVLSVQFLQRTE
jgi:hypothetical protein